MVIGSRKLVVAPASECRSVMRLRLLLHALLSLSLLGGCTSGPAEAKADARRDIRRGELELRIYGELWPAESEYARLLKDHLGVNLRRVASCAVSSELVRDTDAYNEVMREEIEAQHGKGVLERYRAEAEKRFAATRPST